MLNVIMLSMYIPCKSAGHCTSTKGIDKKKPTIALLHNWALWYLTLRLTPSTGYNGCSSKYGVSPATHPYFCMSKLLLLYVCVFVRSCEREK